MSGLGTGRTCLVTVFLATTETTLSHKVGRDPTRVVALRKAGLERGIPPSKEVIRRADLALTTWWGLGGVLSTNLDSIFFMSYQNSSPDSLTLPISVFRWGLGRKLYVFGIVIFKQILYLAQVSIGLFF